MAFVDFYQQSILFGLPSNNPDIHYAFLQGPTTRWVPDGDPAGDLEDHSVVVDIEAFIKSVLHAPADWRVRWAPIIHAVKRNPDFMEHYFQHCAHHKRKYDKPEESDYESLLLMNDAALRVAFPFTPSQGIPSTPLPLTQLVHLVDDGSSTRVLKESSSVPRLGTNDPSSNRAQFTASFQASSGEAMSDHMQGNTRKRKWDSDFRTTEHKKRKLGIASAPGKVNLDIDWEACFPPRPQYESKQPTEVGQRLMELLSIRPHVTVCLVEGNCIQFYHANHSVVLVSSVIDLDNDIDSLIGILIAFRRLALHDRRMLEPAHNAAILRLEGNEKLGGPIEIELGTAISMSPSLVGRSTAVMYGMSPRWPGSRVVVKISWVDEARISEEEFMDKAVEEATNLEHEWALNHLPRFYCVEDVKDPTDASVQELFKVTRFANRDYAYERRQMRIVVQEPLHSLKTLANVRDIGQVMLDVACIHRWLYDHAGILHGDLSPGNIMYRIIESQVHGVLTDYDLSSWKTALTADDPKTSQQVIGTTLYMAQELLKGTSPIHLYRHDLESLFYVMVIIGGHYTIRHTGEDKSDGDERRVVMREDDSPYQDWFEGRDYVLGCRKATFIFEGGVELSSSFEPFRGWLEDLRLLFFEGFAHKTECKKQEYRAERRANEPVPFDDETLGGYISYSAFIEPVRRLTGELEGLVIRYDQSSHSRKGSESGVRFSDRCLNFFRSLGKKSFQ